MLITSYRKKLSNVVNTLRTLLCSWGCVETFLNDMMDSREKGEGGMIEFLAHIGRLTKVFGLKY